MADEHLEIFDDCADDDPLLAEAFKELAREELAIVDETPKAIDPPTPHLREFQFGVIDLYEFITAAGKEIALGSDSQAERQRTMRSYPSDFVAAHLDDVTQKMKPEAKAKLHLMANGLGLILSHSVRKINNDANEKLYGRLREQAWVSIDAVIEHAEALFVYCFNFDREFMAHAFDDHGHYAIKKLHACGKPLVIVYNNKVHVTRYSPTTKRFTIETQPCPTINSTSPTKASKPSPASPTALPNTDYQSAMLQTPLSNSTPSPVPQSGKSQQKPSQPFWGPMAAAAAQRNADNLLNPKKKRNPNDQSL